jgi:FkbM family methyltransferase
MAFEPARSSYSILLENISLNKLSEKAEAFNFALYSEDNKEVIFEFNLNAPGSSGIKFPDSRGRNTEKVLARTLDSVIGEGIKAYDTVIFKMDVEGVEKEVLMGAERVLNSGRDIYLMVEDFVNPEIITYLETTGAEFICKLTPYNSWWRYSKRP